MTYGIDRHKDTLSVCFGAKSVQPSQSNPTAFARYPYSFLISIREALLSHFILFVLLLSLAGIAMNYLVLLATTAALAVSASAASADDWAKRSIYQVITDRYARSAGMTESCNITKYCGGSWSGLVDKLDYIQEMGFTAVQISPIQKNLPGDTIYGEAFHGYWPQDLYEINSHFGNASDLKNLVGELHRRNMYLMVDVVANELAYSIGAANMTAESSLIDYSVFAPFNKSSDFTPFCPIIDWSNKTEFTHCWLGYEGVATPRIKTTDPAIAATLGEWIHDLVSEYDIDGIRIDGAKQIETTFFPNFTEKAGVYAMGEVYDGNANSMCSYQNLTSGLENYALYSKIIEAFTAGKMADLVSTIGTIRQACQSPQYLTTFIENQDNPRFASLTQDIAVRDIYPFLVQYEGLLLILNLVGKERAGIHPFERWHTQDLLRTRTTPGWQLFSI